MNLLLIEDDDILGEGLHDFLCSEGHRVRWCRNLQSVRAVMNELYDAWLVDWQLPDGSGVEWLKRQRSHHQNPTPALLLTARDLLQDRIHGLNSGADDYLVKPFAPEELAARLQAVCRRSAGSANFLVAIGTVQIDLAARAVSVAQQAVNLTAREWALLEVLVLRRGRIVAKADLEQRVLGSEASINSNALEVHVSSLRRKLGAQFIQTVRGLGYRIQGSGL